MKKGKKMIIKALSVMLAVILTFTAAPLSGFVGIEFPDWLDFSIMSSAATSGTCGENLTWTFDDSTGTLTISGTGAMDDFSAGNSPWYSIRLYIHTVYIGNNVTTIGDEAFAFFCYATDIQIPDSITTIGKNAFANCYKLSSITVPENVQSIGEGAFSSCDALANITVDSDNKNYLSDESGVLFNKNKTTIVQYPIANKITSYTIPNSVTTIDNQAFYNCSNLLAVTISDNVTIIGDSAFAGCDNLQNVIIGNSVTTIGDSAFQWCDSLINITLPNSVTTVEECAFAFCDNLASITVDSDNKNYLSDESGVLFNKNKTILVQYPIANKRTSYTIPYSVTTISYAAFGDALNLTDIHYPGSENDWNNILIDSHNDILLKSTIHYNSTGSSSFETDYQQTHVIENYINENAKYEKNYFDGAAVAMDGTDGTADFCIPGLSQIDNLVPQGIAYYKAKNWLLISAYYHEKSGSKQSVPSVIFALDFDTGDIVAEFDIYRETDNMCVAYIQHAGGIAVTDNNLYITDKDSSISYVSLSQLNASSDKIFIEGSYSCEEVLNGASTSYLNYADGILWTGNFYESIEYNTKAGITNSAIVGYELSGTTSSDEWNSLIEKTNSDYRFNVPKSILKIQGMSYKNGKLYLLSSYGRHYDSKLYIVDIPLGNNVMMKNEEVMTAKGIPMLEGMFLYGDYIYTLSESASWYYNGYDSEDMSKNPSDVVWRINYKNIKGYKHTVNCPVDVEVIDNETDEVVGRIKNNIIDEEIAQKENSILMNVDGDSKSFWLSSNGDYKIVLTGNNDGAMDYVVSEFVSSIGEVERVNFYDVEIINGSSYTSTYDLNDFVINEYELVSDDGKTIPYDENLLEEDLGTLNIDITVEGNGAATDSLFVTKGDYVSLIATAKSDSRFLGWYENNNLISEEQCFSFVAKENRNLVAKFVDNLNIETSGTCGENLTWTFDESTGTLTISGIGEMSDYYEETPWTGIKNNITSVVINDGVTTIGDYSFSGCKNVINVTIPESVNVICWHAFSGCHKLENIVIPNGVETIETEAFLSCVGLKNVTISASVSSIGVWAFDNCKSLEGFYVDENCMCYSSDEYGVLFDSEKTNLIQYPIGNTRESYTIPDSVTNICDNSFSGCDNITAITMNNRLINIGNYAFYSCDNLINITLPDSLMWIGADAFSGTTYYNDEANWQDNVLYIGNCLIKSDDSLSGCYEIKTGTTLLADGAFAGTNIISVIIPDTVKAIGTSAFFGCKELINLTIPKSVIKIGSAVIEECDKLTEICYLGTEDEWMEIDVGSYNTDFFNVKVHFNVLVQRDEIIIVPETNNVLPADTILKVEGWVLEQSIIYDVVLMCNDIEIQPNGSVKVKLLVPSTIDGHLVSVYHINEDGTYTDMNAIYENGYMVFETDHFSKYMMTTEKMVISDEYTFSIKQPSRTEIRNKDGIILHTKVEGNAPSGSYVRWESSNGNFDKSADSSNLKIIAKNKGWTTFTAILCAEDGTELARSSVEMYSKSGFFDKIGGFFRSLFGTTKIYEN